MTATYTVRKRMVREIEYRIVADSRIEAARLAADLGDYAPSGVPGVELVHDSEIRRVYYVNGTVIQDVE